MRRFNFADPAAPGFRPDDALLALGVGLLAAAVTVKYRDLRHALPFIIQLWMFASPVIYLPACSAKVEVAGHH